MRRRGGSHGLLLFAVFAASAVFACGSSGPNRPDYGSDDVPEEEIPEDAVIGGLKVTITNPPPGAEMRVSGNLDLGVRVEDDQNEAIHLKVTIDKVPTFTPVEKDLAGPDTTVLPIDTTGIPDGRKWTLLVTATAGERVATATVRLTVDNAGPEIEPLDPTPPEGGSFLGDLRLRFRVKDAGAGVSQIVIQIEDFSYTWPTSGTAAQQDVDTGEIRVPSGAWTGGDKSLTVKAYDGIDGHEGTFERVFSFVQRPSFLGGSTYALPEAYGGTAVAGVMLEDGTSAVVVAGADGLAVFGRDGVADTLETRFELAKGVLCKGVEARDLNGDGLDDVVAFCPVWLNQASNVVVLFLQAAGPSFGKPIALQAPAVVEALALGDLNNDSFPDIAIAVDAAEATVGISMSDATGETLVWGDFKQYSGAQAPRQIAIGQFANVTHNFRNAVMAAREGSSIVTVFPMNAEGRPSSGVNSSMELAVPGATSATPVLGISAAAPVSFSSPTDPPNVMVFGDTVNGRIFTARLDQTSQPKFSVGTAYDRAGVDPRKIVVGDLDGNGTNDVAVLCKGSHLVHVFFGRSQDAGLSADHLTDGPALLAGPTRDLTVVDFDGDGVLDIVTLNQEGTTLTFIRRDPDLDQFAGTPLVLSLVTPASVAAGRFTKPESGVSAHLLDVAVLGQDSVGKNRLAFYVSEKATGLPLRRAETPPLLLDIPAPRKIVALNINASSTSDGGPDDIVLTTANSGSSTPPYVTETAMAFLVSEDVDKHTNVALAKGKGFYAGESPTLVATGDLDWSKVGLNFKFMDLAFAAGYWEQESPPPAAPVERKKVKLFIGNGTGEFKDMETINAEGVTIPEARQPRALIAAPLRRSLTRALANQSFFLDLVTANFGTGDFSIYPNQGDGFLYKDTRVRTFAVGTGAKAVASGFLTVPLDGSVAKEDADKVLPDIVTLLEQEVFVSYNTSDVAQVGLSPEKVSFAPPTPLGHTGLGPTDVALADMNNDSHLDIIVLNTTDSTVTVYLNLGAQTFSQPFVFLTGVEPASMIVADLDGNGCPDIVTGDATGKTLTFLKNTVPCEQ